LKSILKAAIVATVTLLLLSSLSSASVASAAAAAKPPFPTSPCHYVNQVLPDPKCTPGVRSLAVYQKNINSTICVPGYAASVRPPVSYTAPIKILLMHAYNVTNQSRGSFELDHLIPLELGGSPKNVKNLWPEPIKSAFVKDRSVEDKLHTAVCNHTVSLFLAQREIATNWTALIGTTTTTTK